MVYRISVVALFVLATALPVGAQEGIFFRDVWAPLSGNSFRVNSPDTVSGPFRERPEAKKDGLLTIKLEADPPSLSAAMLYMELWGGHPGVANKRFTLNGAAEYKLPEVGTADEHCTYSYPSPWLRLDHLRRGENRFQFTCDKGRSFWGHFLIRQAALRLMLKRTDPALKEAGLGDFTAAVEARPREGTEVVDLSLKLPDELRDKVASVEYWGRYLGYDENGDGQGLDWHGFTKDKRPVAIAATADAPPFSAAWDTSMIPDQQTLTVRAELRLKQLPDVFFRTSEVSISAPVRKTRVVLLYCADLPRPFWSRAGQKRTGRLTLPVSPEEIARAELHVVLWDGGKGPTENYFTLNGHALDIEGGGRHDLLYRVLPLDCNILKRGDNEIALECHTPHHGIEICRPGPAVVLRLGAAQQP